MTLSGWGYPRPDSRATNTAPESKCSGLAAGKIPKAVQYFKGKFKEKKITAEEAEEAEKMLIREMKEADLETEKKTEQ